MLVRQTRLDGYFEPSRPSASQKCFFFDIPPNTRVQILSLFIQRPEYHVHLNFADTETPLIHKTRRIPLDDDDDDIPGMESYRALAPQVSLLLTCHKIYRELSQLVYSSCWFKISEAAPCGLKPLFHLVPLQSMLLQYYKSRFVKNTQVVTMPNLLVKSMITDVMTINVLSGSRLTERQPDPVRKNPVHHIPHEVQTLLLECTDLVAPHDIQWSPYSGLSCHSDRFDKLPFFCQNPYFTCSNLCQICVSTHQGCFRYQDCERQSSSSHCQGCWRYPSSLFLLSRGLRLEATRIFFSRNHFH